MSDEKDDLLHLEIINWEKYQYKNGTKTYSWFKVSSSFFQDHEIRSLSANERIIWIYLLCSAAQVRRSVLKVSVKCIASDCKVYRSIVKAAVSKLSDFNIIRVVPGTQKGPYNKGEESRVEEILLPQQKKEELPASLGVPPVIAEFPSITEELLETWVATYLDEKWVHLEIQKAKSWIKANPRKAPRKNFPRFFNGWLSRSFDEYRKTLQPKPKKNFAVER